MCVFSVGCCIVWRLRFDGTKGAPALRVFAWQFLPGLCLKEDVLYECVCVCVLAFLYTSYYATV